ncbi:DUF2884 family protein [Alteromonas sp. H39]|uniref:DUF2884 family protein n=1 Tax=Alteromonas sp. H39 TaxID=3389876 RepID=UPI0039E0B618
MKTRTTLSIIAAGMLVSGAVNAHAEFNNDHCDVELDGNIQYYKGLLTVDMNNGSTMTITDDYELTINGESVSLTSEQQRWVEDYYDQIDTAIPMTLNIAAEGLEIASTAVGEVFGELLGADDEMVREFDDLFTGLSQEMKTRFYDAQGNIRVNSNEFNQPGWFDNAWENEFEARIESLVSQSVGRIMVAIGTEMMFGDGDMTAFEQKMERFGESIENRVEKQARALEDDAEALCAVLAKADYAEKQMQKHIDGLDDLNLLDMKGGELKM